MGFDPLPETKAVRAPNRLAGSGTHRQECLTRRESAAIHDYPRATGLSHHFAKALLIGHFSPELSPRSWWIAPRRSSKRLRSDWDFRPPTKSQTRAKPAETDGIEAEPPGLRTS
jgi:hypothetical protein